MQRNAGSFRCDHEGCGATFTREWRLLEHRTAHTGEHHIRKEHLQLFKYSCYYPDCAKVFAMRVKQKRPDKSWQKRLGGSSSQKAPVIEEDLRALFEQKLHFRIHSKVECNLSGLFNERKIPRIIEQEVGLRELFEPPLLKLPKVA
ncbi:P43 protein, partial [Polypterus senegalus]